eukprot:5637486-Pyramimonas_sp.AAC.1
MSPSPSPFLPREAALVKQLEALASFHEDTWHLADGMSDWCTRVARRLRAMMRHVEQAMVRFRTADRPMNPG